MPTRRRAPAVSVIVPARNAAATLSETLGSLLAQTMPDWEAIVVEDSSTDETRSIALELAQADPRVKVVDCTGTGEGAARNAGIARATAEWLLFLDADDLIEPYALEIFLGALTRDSSLDGAVAGSVRITPDGEPVSWDQWGEHHEIFEAVSMLCPFAIHACIVRRRVVEAVGGFDTELRAAADWDLWQRVVRAGAKLGRVEHTLARYRMRPEAVSNHARRVFDGGRRVIARGHRPDPRVPDPVPEYASGRPAAHEYAALLRHACWAAGLAIGGGEDASPFLIEIESDRASIASRLEGDADSAIDTACSLRLDPEVVAYGLKHAVCQPACLLASEWPRVWPGVADPIRRFLASLERVSRVSELAWRTELLLGPRDGLSPAANGRWFAVDVELTRPIESVSVPSGADRLVCVGMLEGEPLGLIDLPVCDGVVPASVIADAVTERWYWRMLVLFLERRGLIAPGDIGGAVWSALMAEVWDDAALDRRPRPERRSGGDRVEIEVSGPLPEIAMHGSAVDIVVHVGGRAVDVVRLKARRRLSLESLRDAITRALGPELFRAIVREGLVGTDLANPAPLRETLARRASARASAPEQGEVRPVLAIGRRAVGAAGTSSSRNAVLPAECADELERSAAAAGEPVSSTRGTASVEYDPDRLWSGPVTASSWPGESGRGRGRLSFRSRRPTVRTEWLPILSYERVCRAPRTDGGVSWQAFAEQCACLHDAGFRTISLDRWEAAVRYSEPVAGRAVVLAFEDGGRDFQTAAWPVMRGYGFGAIVLLVTGDVGRPETDAPSWTEVRSLRADGVDFGSRSAGHRPLTTLGVAEVVNEVAASRTTLTEQLGHPPTCFSYPCGDVDGAVEHLVGACGYVYGLTNHRGRAGLRSSLLRLPTIGVRGKDTLEDFVRKLML